VTEFPSTGSGKILKYKIKEITEELLENKSENI